MRKLACLVFELEDNESVEDIIASFDKSGKIVKCIPVTKKKNQSSDWRENLQRILNDLGEDISTMGYGLMFDIMEEVEKNPKYKKHFLVKELYAPAIKKTGKTYSQVERNIRAMIERIFNNNSVEYVHSILGVSAESYVKMPNANFLALIIQKIF